MMLSLAGAVLRVALVLLLSIEVFGQLNAYPEWFLFPRKFQGVTTGMTYRGNSALADAETVTAAYRKCLVDGVLRVISKEDISFPHRSSDYFYYYDEGTYQSVKGTLSPADSLVTNSILRQSIAAFVADTSVKVPKQRLKTATLQRPAWINTGVSIRDGYYYSTGMYPSKGNENDSWKTAEERAIFAVLLTLELDVTTTTTLDNTVHKSDEYQKVIEFRVNRWLSDISVIERFPDQEGKMNHVLIRLKAQK